MDNIRTTDELWQTLQTAADAGVTDEGSEMMAALMGTNMENLAELSEAYAFILSPKAGFEVAPSMVAHLLQAGAILASVPGRI